MITHVVMWKLADATVENATRCKVALDSLRPVVDEIRDWSVGVDVLHSPRSWDLVLVSTFDDLAALERYRVHPEHEKVAALVAEAAETRASVDFQT